MNLRTRGIPLLLIVLPAVVAVSALTAHIVSIPLIRNVRAVQMRSLRTVSEEMFRIASDSLRSLPEGETAESPAEEAVAKWEALERIHRYRAMEGTLPLHVVIVDDRDRILSDPSRLLAGSAIPSLSGLSAGSDLSLRDGQGNALLARHRHFPDWGWHILAIVREADLAGETKRIRVLFFCAVAASLLALLSVMALLFRILVRNPLLSLIRAMRGFPGGNAFPAPESGCGITRDVAGEYNRMTALLHRRQVELTEQAELVEANPDLILKVARDGRILYANRTVEQTLYTLGLPPQHYELLLPEDLEAIIEDVLAGRKQGRRVFWRMRDRIIDYSVSALEPEEAVLCHGMDVTERISWDERLLRYRTAETWKNIVSAAAHDLSSLMAGILEHASVLAGRRNEDPAVAGAIDGIEKAAEGGLSLVRRMSGFGRKEQKDIREVDVNRLVDETVGIVLRALPKKIEIRVETAKEVPVVSGNVPRLTQCLLHLLTAAAEEGNEGGILSVTTGAVRAGPDRHDTLSCIPEGRYVRVAVEKRDRGGDDADRTPPHDPIRSGPVEIRDGGIAMTMVRGIVEDHGGFLAVRSLPGEGTAFHVLLPAGDAAADRPSAGLEGVIGSDTRKSG